MKLKKLDRKLGALRYGVKWVVRPRIVVKEEGSTEEQFISLGSGFGFCCANTSAATSERCNYYMGCLCLGECSANIKIPVT